MISAEIEILLKAGSHPNIVELADVYETKDDLKLVMELVTGGELFEHLINHGAYSEDRARHHLRMIAQVIQ